MKNKSVYYILAICGILLIGYALYIYIISPDFTYAAKPSKENLVYYIIIRIIIGLVFTISVVFIVKYQLRSSRILIYIFSIGAIARLLLVPSEPILEDDFNRYLWDGAVTANGYNPFKYAPNMFMERDSLKDLGPKTLHNLADSSGAIINRINHPHIRTIYPPIAQTTFAIAYLVKPWSVTIWKFLLFLIDISVFYLLILLLKRIGKPLVLVAIYWWNPILLHEIFNAGHMDLIMYPLILLGILFFLKNKIVVSSSFFALAVGGKIWPVIFIPFALKKTLKNKRVLFSSLVISSSIIMLILLPIIVTKLDNSLGFVTYSKNWTNNESVFRLVNLLIKEVIQLFNINYHCSLCLSRWVVIIIFSTVIIYYLRKDEKKSIEIIFNFFPIVAIMFILSPTQFPWYYTWVLPFLVLNPRLSFVAYTILLPLYQLKYSWPYLVWVEHLPIVGLFIMELYSSKFRNFLTAKNEFE